MGESEEKGPREKVSLFSGPSQRAIIVCFEMGVPYFKVRSMGILRPSSRTWKRKRGWERERKDACPWRGERERAQAHGGERERKHFGSSFYMFSPPPGPALRKLGLVRSAVCST